jgi:hypothetical protein
MTEKISAKKITIVLLAIIGIVLAPTIAEFLIALHNRYSVYPAGTDTNMLANTIILQSFLAAMIAIACVHFLRIKQKLRFIILPICVIIALVAVNFLPSYVPAKWCQYELTIYDCSYTGVRENSHQLPNYPYDTNINNWKTYTNEQYGFTFLYPSDWEVYQPTESQVKEGVVVSLQSPYGKERASIRDSYAADLVVSRWDTVNTEFLTGQKQTTFKNLDELMTNRPPFLQEQSTLQLDNNKAYLVTIGGFGANDGILVEYKGVYQLSFETIDKGLVSAIGVPTNIVQTIASTFEFTK